jgi:hypothetical protein
MFAYGSTWGRRRSSDFSVDDRRLVQYPATRWLALKRQNGTKSLPSYSESDVRETRRGEILGFGCCMCEHMYFDTAMLIE